MERSISAISKNTDEEAAFKEVTKQIDAVGAPPIVILFFADYQIFKYASEQFRKKYPQSQVMGSTTYMNLVNGVYSHQGLSALAIYTDIEVSTGTLLEIDRHPMNYVGRVENALKELGTEENTCCIEFCTAFSNGEELVLDTFSQTLEGRNIPVFGGSGGVGDGIEETLVSLNGQVLRKACVFMFIHNLNGRIAFYRENIYKPTSHCFTVTGVECEERTVYEYNDRPAADVIKEVLDATDENLLEQHNLYPVGRLADNNIYIMDVKSINPDRSISYYARVYNMTRMVLLEPDDFEKVWKETRVESRKLIADPAFTLVINCCGRTKKFEHMGFMDGFTDMVSGQYGSIVTLSGYGEQLNDVHLNQTLLLVMFE